MNQRFVDLLAMSRFANLPTVWSNAVLGFLIVAQLSWEIQTHEVLAIFASLSCLYLGGCFLNDWQDAKFDAQYRPERAIPSGRWARGTIGFLALFLLALALGIGAAISLPYAVVAVGIVVCIVAYTHWHKTHIFSLFFMAGARALIYPACVMAPLALAQVEKFRWEQFPVLALFPISLGSYILGISLMARFESRKKSNDRPPVVPLICLSLPVFLISGILIMMGHPLAALVPLVLFLGVLIWNVKRLQRTGEVGNFVAVALASIPLVDALFVMREGLASGNLFFIVACPLLALLALGLQKIAPAT